VTVQVNNDGYQYILANILRIVWRRRRVLYASIVAAAAATFLLYSVTGERYEAYTLLRIGQGIKERAASGNGPFGDGIDLAGRMDSLAKIGQTDYVVRLAAIGVGPERVFDERQATLLSRFRQAISKYVFQRRPPEKSGTEGLTQAVLGGLRGAISARQEGRSDLLRISFRHADPTVAAAFANELSNALVAMQAELVQVPGADIFFQQQAKRLEEEAEKAASDLQKFSIEASIYSVAEQRALLLKRGSELSTQIAATRGAIEDRRGQRQAIVDQLLVMRPVTQSKTVTTIVNRMGGRDDKGSAVGQYAGAEPAFDEHPPLLLVRVYQDAMALLLKINADLNGSRHLEKLLEEELHSVNAQLADMSSKEAEYDRLKRVLTRASTGAEQYGARMIEEQTSLDVAKKVQLSSVRVVQLAEQPTVPVAPHLSHLVVLALFGGLAAGAGIAAMLEMASMRQRQRESEYENNVAAFVRETERGKKGLQAGQ
jgi:succinoglycan biosynthesis transport protein ExoP